MQIDAKYGAILNIVALVLAAIGAGTVQLAGVPPDTVHLIQAWALNLTVVLAMVNSVLHLYASSNPGPLAPPDPPAVKAATVAAAKAASLVLAIGLSALVLGWASPAGAQDAPKPAVRHKVARVPTPSPRPPQTALTAFAAAASSAVPAGKLSVNQATANPVALLQKFTIDDLNAALTDANGQTPPDTTAAACYTALIPIVQSGIANPLPKGPGAFQAVQKVRDAKALLANLQSPTGPLAALNTACAPLLLDAQNTLIQLGLMTGAVVATGGAGLVLPFALPIPLPGIP